MKKKLGSFLVACLVFVSLSACKSGGLMLTYATPPDGSVNPISSPYPTGDTAATAGEETASPLPADTDAPSASSNSKPTSTPGDSGPTGSIFSVVVGTVRLTLQEQIPEATLNKIPLKRLADKTEVLGEGNDTFTGSSVRTVQYSGLKLLLFAPKDDITTFWLMQIQVTDKTIAAFAALHVGDTLNTVLKVFPEAEKAENQSGSDIYRYSEEYDELAFTIVGNKVTEMTLTYYMP
ncbi:hypothetical protein IZU99_05710 [Oscillospiraceae bacterium CM]|nr:hypothetical protein IZU99_05710 [Oscillospiraceae bacterium CM]